MSLNNGFACKGSWSIYSVYKLLFPFHPWCAELGTIYIHISRVNCQKGPTCHAYAWQIIGNIMVFNDLVIEGVRASAVTILTQFVQSIPFQHQHRECIIHKVWLIPWHLVHLFLTSISIAASFSNTKCQNVEPYVYQSQAATKILKHSAHTQLWASWGVSAVCVSKMF